MSVGTGIVWMSVVVTVGSIIFVSFALWIRSHDNDADK